MVFFWISVSVSEPWCSCWSHLCQLPIPVKSDNFLWVMDHSPSKHAGSDSLLIWIRFTCDQDWFESIVQKQAWWFLHASLYPDQIHMAKTWHSQPGPNWTQAAFAQYVPGHLWKNASESESGKLVALAGQLHSARTRPDDCCTPAGA